MRNLTFVFVHGTGVRTEPFEKSVALIRRSLAPHPELSLIPCSWGEKFGAQLRAEGASIPKYDTTKALAHVPDENVAAVLWELLLKDPFYELRTLALTPAAKSSVQFGQLPEGDLIHHNLKQLEPGPELAAALHEGEIAVTFNQARAGVLKNDSYRDALKGAVASPGEHRAAAARAVVAYAIALDMAEGRLPRVALNPQLRDDIITALIDKLGGGTKSLGGWVAKQLIGLALRMGALNFTARKRGALTDATYPASGDILVYQADGGPIRNYIRACISEAKSSVVLLGHSLGGVACLELLVNQDLPQVKMLITAGSQAPYLYEIGALRNFEFGKDLPHHFRCKWLNIYDERDLLSYIGAGIFKGRVEDVKVDNNLPFPYCHSGYWDNHQTWKEIFARLPQ